MRHVRRLIQSTVAVAAILLLWWAGLPVLAVFVALTCGLAGLVYLISGRSAGRAEEERERNERYLRDIPPPS